MRAAHRNGLGMCDPPTAESMPPIDLISCLLSEELRRSERLLERRRKQAQFRDPQKSLDNFDFCHA